MKGAENFVIRNTTADDILELRTMHGQSWRDTYENTEHGISREWLEQRTAAWITSEGIEKSKEYFKDVFGHPDHLHQVAENEQGDIIGLVHMSNSEQRRHLQAIYIDKRYYGTGLAQQLMDRAIAWGDTSSPIYLEVVTYNERAKAFYRKYHFKEKPGTETFFSDIIPILTMEREGETV